jgi:hypothetical protein
MILDAYHEVFIWHGSTCSAAEKNIASIVAKDYVSHASQIDGRSPDVPISIVTSGEEPIHFKCQFQGWSNIRKVFLVHILGVSNGKKMKLDIQRSIPIEAKISIDENSSENCEICLKSKMYNKCEYSVQSTVLNQIQSFFSYYNSWLVFGFLLFLR